MGQSSSLKSIIQRSWCFFLNSTNDLALNPGFSNNRNRISARLSNAPPRILGNDNQANGGNNGKAINCLKIDCDYPQNGQQLPNGYEINPTRHDPGKNLVDA